MNLSNFAIWLLESERFSIDEKNKHLNNRCMKAHIEIKVAMSIVATLSSQRQQISSLCANYFKFSNKIIN